MASRRALRIATLAAKLARQRAPVLAPTGVVREDDPREIWDEDAGLRDGEREALQVGGQRGMSAVLDYGQAQSLLAWAADDPHAKAVTVTLDGPRLLAAPDTATDCRVFARVTWGTEGGLAEAEIDWIRGTAFTVWASHLSLAGVHEGIASPVLGSTARSKVTAHCGYMPVGDALPPQRTRYIPATPVGANVVVEIPPYSHGFHVLWTPATTIPTIDILGAQSTPTVLGSLVISSSDPFQQLPIAIPNDAQRIRFNVGGTALLRARLVFKLRV